MDRFPSNVATARCLLIVLTASGCLREARTTELLRARYETAGLRVSTRAAIDSLVDALSISEGVCLSVDAPCRLSPDHRATTAGADLCLQWGRDIECFAITEQTPSVLIKPLNAATPGRIALWLFARLDPATAAAASEQADHEISALEQASPENASSVWANGRLIFAAPQLEAGVQVQGGYRRWLSSYLLLSAGGGYEQVLLPRSRSALLREALLLTARLEFSSVTMRSRVLNVPWLTAYMGATAAFVLGTGGGLGMRGFVGVSSLIPVSVELGVSVLSVQGVSPRPAFFIAAGFGL